MVLDVGGFLGVGEHDIAVSIDSSSFLEEPVRYQHQCCTSKSTP